MGQGGGGGVPRQHPSSGHLAVADTWAPPRAAWLSPCPRWLSRGRTPAPGPPTVPSAPWRPALCRRPRTRATRIRWSHVPTSDAAMGTSSNATCCPATAQAPCVAAATPPSQTVLITCLGDRADSAPKRRGQATAADKLGAAVAPHRPCLACSTTEEDEVDTGDKVATGTRWPRGQGGHGDKVATGDPRRCLSCSCSSLQLGGPNGLALAPAGRAGPCRLSPSRVP